MITIESVFYRFMFGLAFALSFLYLRREKRIIITGLPIFVSTTFVTGIGQVFKIGENVAGFALLSLAIILIAVLINSMLNKHFVITYMATAVIAYFICIISDGLSMTTMYAIKPPFSVYIYSAMIPLIASLISKIGRLLYDKLRSHQKKERLFYILGIYSIIIFLFIFLIFIWTLNVTALHNQILSIISILVFLTSTGIFVIAFTYYERYLKLNYEKEVTKKEIDNIIQSAKMMAVNYEKVRSFRHDYKNIMLSLTLHENNEAIDLLHEREKEFAVWDSQYDDIMAHLMKIDNMPFVSLVSSKAISFINSNVSISMQVIGTVTSFYIDDYDLIRLIGIFLDNAFEEAICTEECWVRLGILADNESITIIIENSLREDAPSVDSLMEKGFSIKGEGRGIGLENVSEIMKHYKRCFYKLGKREQNIFYVELTLCAERNNSSTISSKSVRSKVQWSSDGMAISSDSK